MKTLTIWFTAKWMPLVGSAPNSQQNGHTGFEPVTQSRFLKYKHGNSHNLVPGKMDTPLWMYPHFLHCQYTVHVIPNVQACKMPNCLP